MTPTTTTVGFDSRIYEAIRLLAALDQDHATSKNDQGYNGADTDFGHILAEKPAEAWSLKMACMAYRLLRKYGKQLASAGIDYDAIVDPTTVVAAPKGARITLQADGLAFRSRRDDPAVTTVKNLPARTWLGDGGFYWRISLTRNNLPGLRQLYASGVSFDVPAIAALKALA